MAIFSRRSIQRMLDENAAFLNAAQLGRHVRHLNKEGRDFIDVEWEVAVLNVFSKVGRVRHEPDLGGGRSIDLLFSPDSNPAVSLIADIATVTDEGFEEENPQEQFEIELFRRIDRLKLRANSFSFRIGHYPERGFHPTGKKRLKLPERSRFDEVIFNNNFKRFLAEIAQRPNEPRNYSVYTPDTELGIAYNPHQRFSSSTGAVYRKASSVTNNPVYNALKRKAAQLKKVGFDGPRGIILCDGGSDMMHHRPRSGFGFDASDVIKDFLRQNQSITFVLTISSIWADTSRRPAYDNGSKRLVETTLYANDSFRSVDRALQENLSAAEQYFPEPDNTAEGARLTLKQGYDSKKYVPYYGGFEVSSEGIKISARVLLGLLSGRIDQRQFFKDYRFIPSEEGLYTMRNPFEYQLGRGARISEIKIEPSEDDDNYLTFTFREPGSQGQ